MQPLQLLAQTSDGTKALGAAVAAMLEPGDVISLTGELGAGKTTFVQGAAEALGVTSPVVSPTFTLIREYAGTELTIYHVDVYRLERLQDVIDLGFEEMTDSGGITFVEWGDAIEALLTDSRLQIEFESAGLDTDSRRVRITGTGPVWAARWPLVETAIEGWKAPA